MSKIRGNKTLSGTWGEVWVADIVSYTLNGGLASLSCGYGEYFTLEEVDIHAPDR